jgi:hypothetical protein
MTLGKLTLPSFVVVPEEKNDNVATTFGLDNIDVITTFPTDLTKTAAQNDNAGRFGLILSAISKGLRLWSLTPFSTIFQLYSGGQFFCKGPYRKSLTKYIT